MRCVLSANNLQSVDDKFNEKEKPKNNGNGWLTTKMTRTTNFECKFEMLLLAIAVDPKLPINCIPYANYKSPKESDEYDPNCN